MGLITWTDKEQATVNQQPEPKKWTHENANEVKTRVNENYFISMSFRDEYAGGSSYPSAGGRWTGGVPAKGDMYSLTDTLEVDNAGDVRIYGTGTILIALINNPGNSHANWGAANAGSTGVWVYKETPAGVQNGVNQNFTLSAVPDPNSEHIFRNGLFQSSGYSIVGNTITFTIPPDAEEEIRVTFKKPGSESLGSGSSVNHWRGDYAGTTEFPSTGGTLAGGVPASGDMWRLTDTLQVGGNIYPPGSVIMAAINTPGNTLANWIKLATQQ